MNQSNRTKNPQDTEELTLSDFAPLKDILSKLSKEHGIESNYSPQEHERLKVQWYNDSVGNLNEVDGHDCEECKNKGFIAKLDDNGCEVHTPCRCQKVRATLKRARASGLGDIIREFTFKKFTAAESWQENIKGIAIEFCNDENAKWFYIGGQVGCGKSHLCTAIAAHYIKAGNDVKYMLWMEESKPLKALVNDVRYAEYIEPYKTVDVLYIDDFLKVQNGENPTHADIKLAFEIINHRLLEADKITIISSEKMLDELMEYDEATMSRIYQQTGKYKINIPKDRNKNYRLKGN